MSFGTDGEEGLPTGSLFGAKENGGANSPVAPFPVGRQVGTLSPTWTLTDMAGCPSARRPRRPLGQAAARGGGGRLATEY